MIILRLALFLMLFIAGCVSAPFQNTAEVPVGAVDARSVAERFSNDLPTDFQLLQTITFEYGAQTFSGLGFAEVNAKEQAFSVVCMNYMGVKIFEVYGNKHEIRAPFVMDELKRGGNVAVAIGEDIRRIYFDLIPSADAIIDKGKYRILFTQPSGQGVMEFIFAGAGHHLVEKTYYEDRQPVWSVSYYEYQSANGKLNPGGIVLENFRRSYRLIIRLKEIYK
jgi:hypothetical protein